MYPKIRRIVDSGLVEAIRRRDGFCLYGLIHKDGCNGPLDVHHIKTRGSGGDDVPENAILLCRKHHMMAQERKITAAELRAIVEKFHGRQK